MIQKSKALELLLILMILLSISPIDASATITPTNITFGQPTGSFTVASGHNAIMPYGDQVLEFKPTMHPPMLSLMTL